MDTKEPAYNRDSALQAAPPLLSVMILTATALAYEVLLVRLFSIIHWQHFTFMIISLALLGYGVSGSVVSLLRMRLLRHFELVFLGNALLFGIASIVCFMAVQLFPFNTLEMLWDRTQWLRLLLSYLLLAFPFFFVANAILLTMMRFEDRIPLVYGIDLLGAGLGAIGAMLLMQLLPPETVLRILGLGAIVAGLAVPGNLRWYRQKALAASLLVAALLLLALIPQKWLQPQLSEYKGLSQALLIKGATPLKQETSAISRIDVVASPEIPFRYAPGLSLLSPAWPPEQLAVFRDGDSMNTLDRVSDESALEYHAYTSSALPYHIHENPRRVLILNAATGSQALQARRYHVPEIEAVEADALLGKLITEQFTRYFDSAASRSALEIHTLSPRGFAAQPRSYDLVLVPPPGASSGGASGSDSTSSNYDYTVEAIQAYLELLNAEGMLAITAWTDTPARGGLKLFTTAVAAMRNGGIHNPQDNIAWIRSWNTTTLLLGKTLFSSEEIAGIRDFAFSRNFDLAWTPDIRRQETNRYNILSQPVYYLTAQSLLTDPQQRFITAYPYDIQPATDDRPFFSHYFKWSQFRELLSLPLQNSISSIGVAYPTLVITLLQALVCSLALILLPLLLLPANPAPRKTNNNKRSVFLYFLCIGLGFLFIELAFIEKLTLVLSQPIYAVAVTLCAFLVFSGLGSLYVQRFQRDDQAGKTPGILTLSIFMIIGITVLYTLLIPRVSSDLMSLPLITRLLAAFLLAAPLAFAMGMPFAVGLTAVQSSEPQLVPWAWGINGCASVVSAVLAVLLAIDIGFSGVMLLAAALYLVAWLNRLS